MKYLGTMHGLAGELRASLAVCFRLESQVRFFPSLLAATGLGGGSSLLAAVEYGQGGSRSSSGFCRIFPGLAGQMKGQSQRWSIDVNKTNSR